MNAKQIRMIIGIIGNVISVLISLSHMPTFIKIYKKKSVEDYQPHHHVAMVMKCSLWVLYGLPLVHKNSILVTTSNGVGFIIEVIYVVVFLIYCDNELRVYKDNILLCLLLEAAAVMFFYGLTLWVMDNLSIRHTLIGVVCNVYNFLTYFALAIDTMWDNANFTYMPLWLSLVSFINAGIWTAYSVIYEIDIYVLVSYGVATFLCASQLVVHAYKSIPNRNILNTIIYDMSK